MGIFTKLLIVLVIFRLCQPKSTEEEVMDTIFGYLELVHFPDEAEAQKDSAATYDQESKLISKMFKFNEYDNTKIPKTGDGSALSISTTFSLDHIEALAEDEGTVTVHGSLTMKWKDPTFSWNPDEHAKIRYISRTMNEYSPIQRPWIPNIRIQSATPAEERKTEGLDTLSSILSIYNDGQVAYQRKFTAKASCNFEYKDFPYDKQKCRVVFLTTHLVKEAWFGFDAEYDNHYVRQLRKTHHAPMIGDFVLDWCNVFNSVIGSDPDSDMISKRYEAGSDPNVKDSKKVAMFVEMTFERIDDQYFFLFNIPLVVVVLMVQCSALLDTKKCYFTIGLAFLLFVNQGGLILEKFPPINVDRTPLIALMHYLTLAYIVTAAIGTTVLAHFYGARAVSTSNCRPTPANYRISETWARVIYFGITGAMAAGILIGTLVVGSWREWDADEDKPREGF